MSVVSEASGTGQPSRYNRSFGGLIGSIIVLVLVVIGIVLFRGAFRNTPEYQPDDVDAIVMRLDLRAWQQPAVPQKEQA